MENIKILVLDVDGTLTDGKIYVDDKDMEDLKYLKEKGIDIFIQDVPDDTKIPIDNFINS